jgi:hypothetical protein
MNLKYRALAEIVTRGGSLTRMRSGGGRVGLMKRPLPRPVIRAGKSRAFSRPRPKRPPRRPRPDFQQPERDQIPPGGVFYCAPSPEAVLSSPSGPAGSKRGTYCVSSWP